jgi:hypothetical protein
MVFLYVDRIDFRPHRADLLLRNFTSRFWSLPNHMRQRLFLQPCSLRLSNPQRLASQRVVEPPSCQHYDAQ